MNLELILNTDILHWLQTLLAKSCLYFPTSPSGVNLDFVKLTVIDLLECTNARVAVPEDPAVLLWWSYVDCAWPIWSFICSQSVEPIYPWPIWRRWCRWWSGTRSRCATCRHGSHGLLPVLPFQHWIARKWSRRYEIPTRPLMFKVRKNIKVQKPPGWTSIEIWENVMGFRYVATPRLRGLALKHFKHVSIAVFSQVNGGVETAKSFFKNKLKG